ncbi:hypothetical protein A2609_00695 [Candidatus Kaiserbacteria bacterium RIFOXYD1_FULL_47_14]|uniref:Toxin-antitoxin system protein n=1 Tax=Candidatus Kaiserbacteria bacterium RIFOXYD1_FULL_47_14 TaxID=1798533 RepID=A0A1F6G6M5_9BACT|nr:MAG: hypothetical protein A2609_00695 [Candidatus Kaiserbacteria bacterium RIFOXYD1_FULL_47_14]
MEKDFDEWNKVKKRTHEKSVGHESFPKEREVWWCSVGVNIGVETDGKHDTFERPVLIVRIFNKEMLWAVPITSTMKDSPFYYPFLFKNEDRSLILTQIRVMSTKRLLRQVDVLSEEDFGKVIESLVGLLKAKPPHKEGALGGRSH